MEGLNERFDSFSFSKVKWDASLKKKLFSGDNGDVKNISLCKMYKKGTKIDEFIASYPSNNSPILVERRRKNDESDLKKAISLVRDILNRVAKTLRRDSSSSLYEYSENEFRTCLFAVAMSSEDLFDKYGFYYDENDRSIFVTEEPLAGSTTSKYGCINKKTIEKCNYHSKNTLKSKNMKFNPDHVFLDFSIKLRKWKKCSFFLKRDEKSANFSLKHDGYILSERCFVFDFELKYQNMKYTIITKAPSKNAVDLSASFEYEKDTNNEQISKYKNGFENIQNKIRGMGLLNEKISNGDKHNDDDDFFQPMHQSKDAFKASRYESERVISKWRSFLKKNIVSITDETTLVDMEMHESFSELLRLRFKPYKGSDFSNNLMILYSEAVNGRKTESKTKGGLAHYRLYREREFDAFLTFKSFLKPFVNDDTYEHPSLYGIYDKTFYDAQTLMDESSVKNITIVSVVMLGILDVLFYDMIV